jgi:hypothetical protein
MSRRSGVDPDDFKRGVSEDMTNVIANVDIVRIHAEQGLTLDEIIDTMYSLDYSPDQIETIMRELEAHGGDRN